MTSRKPPDATELAAARSLLGVGSDATRAEIAAAWKRCMRITHPDTAGGSDDDARTTAAHLSARVNEARDLLIEDLGRQIEAQRPVQEASTQAARTEHATGSKTATARAAAFQGVRIADAGRHGRSDPVSGRGHRGIYIGLALFLGVTVIVLVAVLLTRSSGGRARIAPSGTGTSPTTTSTDASDEDLGDLGGSATFGVPLPAPTPEIAVQELLFAVSAGSVEVLQGVLSPLARQDDVQAILSSLNREGSLQADLHTAASSVSCTETPGLNQALCTIERPPGLLSGPLELTETPEGWRLMGWGPEA